MEMRAAAGEKPGGGGRPQHFGAHGKYAKTGDAKKATAPTPEGFDDIAADHPKVRIEISPKRFADQPTWAIDRLEVAPDARGQGHAGAALRDITTRADQLAVHLALTPEQTGAAGGLSTSELKKWYARHGFIPNKGRYPDITESMVRPPEEARAAAVTMTTMVDEDRPRSPVEIRSTVTEMTVDWAERTIELVAMPYDQDAAVVVHGRAVLESCAPGAFDGLERRAQRVKVNRDHDPQRTVGRAVGLYPNRAEGLVAKLRIAPKLQLGDDTLALAEDHALEASVGFAVMPGGERWLEGRSRRRLERLFLDHIALVPEGAYDAQVIDVRSLQLAPVEYVATPNLDEVMAWLRRR